MPRFTFQYTPFQITPSDPFPVGQTVRRPLLVARLRAQSTQKELNCVVWPDSGADHCVFPLSFAIALGLNPLTMKSQMTGGVGNSGNVTFYETVNISINHAIEFDAFVGFTNGMEAQGLGLLGQAGFFSRYSVIFDHTGSLFHIDLP